MFFSHTDFSLSFPPPLFFSLSLKAMRKCSQVRIKRRKASKLVDYVVENSIVFTIFYLLHLSITEKGRLKSLTVVVDLLVSPSSTLLHFV